MCQYDLGYNLYCTNADCGKVEWVMQDSFREDDYPSVFNYQPCTCSARWYRWHYHATRFRRDDPPARGLCKTCRVNRNSFQGKLRDAEKQWPDITKNIPPTWDPKKNIPQIGRGWMQEIDTHTAEPVNEAQRPRRSHDTTPSSGGTPRRGTPRRGSPTSDLFRLSPEPGTLSRHSSSRSRRAADEQFLAPPPPPPPPSDRHRHRVQFDTNLPGRGGRASPTRADPRRRLDNAVTGSHTPIVHSLSGNRNWAQMAAPRVRHRTYSTHGVEGQGQNEVSEVTEVSGTSGATSTSTATPGSGGESESYYESQSESASGVRIPGRAGRRVDDGDDDGASWAGDEGGAVQQRRVQSTLSRGWYRPEPSESEFTDASSRSHSEAESRHGRRHG